jgi:hypothetical protein
MTEQQRTPGQGGMGVAEVAAGPKAPKSTPAALLLSLPDELRSQVLASLDACTLAYVAAVCKLLRVEAVRAHSLSASCAYLT